MVDLVPASLTHTMANEVPPRTTDSKRVAAQRLAPPRASTTISATPAITLISQNRRVFIFHELEQADQSAKKLHPTPTPTEPKHRYRRRRRRCRKRSRPANFSEQPPNHNH
jgi:hypothetical protein